MTKRKSLSDLELQFLAEDTQETSNSPTVQAPTNKPTIVEKIMQVQEKEPTVRFTVDLSQTLHYKLSLLALRSGKKKAEIVRLLLEESLINIEE